MTQYVNHINNDERLHRLDEYEAHEIQRIEERKAAELKAQEEALAIKTEIKARCEEYAAFLIDRNIPSLPIYHWVKTGRQVKVIRGGRSGAYEALEDETVLQQVDEGWIVLNLAVEKYVGDGEYAPGTVSYGLTESGNIFTEYRIKNSGEPGVLNYMDGSLQIHEPATISGQQALDLVDSEDFVDAVVWLSTRKEPLSLETDEHVDIRYY